MISRTILVVLLFGQILIGALQVTRGFLPKDIDGILAFVAISYFIDPVHINQMSRYAKKSSCPAKKQYFTM